MEIRIPKADGPHYMAEIVFSVEDGKVRIEIVDEKNYQKCLYLIDTVQFNAMVDLLLMGAT